MKKYLENLEKELKKLKISSADIAEILADHKEMIEAAYEDGVSDEELLNKFGDPDQVAKELFSDSHSTNFGEDREPLIEEGELEGYSLVTSFPVLDNIKAVKISLVSEDVKYFPYDGAQIEVYGKRVKDVEDYTISFNENTLTLKKSKKGPKFRIGANFSKSAKFVVKVPFEQYLDLFDVKLVSGDIEIKNLQTKDFDIKTTSGDVEGQYVTVENKMKLTAVSGDIELDYVKSNGMEISLVSGDMELNKVELESELSVNSVSGDVEAKDVKGTHINFRTVSGDFEGEEVYVESVEFKSVSGDFEIKNSLKDHEIAITSQKSLSGKVRIN